MQDLRISVVICCYAMDRLRDVHDAVNSVMSQTRKPHEVIVSVDHTPEVHASLMAHLPSSVIIVLNERTRGLSETRNVGIRASTGDVVAFIDDDAVAAPDWLEKLAPQYEDCAVIAVGGKALPLWGDSGRPRWFPEELDWIVGCTHRGLHASNGEVRNMIGCNMSFRREAFERAGLFNPKVGRVGKLKGVGEEADICLRVKHAMPERIILQKHDAVIYHKVPRWRATWRYMVRRAFDEGLYKVIVERLAPKSSVSSLSSENSYLRYVLTRAVPTRIRRWYNTDDILQTLAILLCVMAVGAGYARGRILAR